MDGMDVDEENLSPEELRTLKAARIVAKEVKKELREEIDNFMKKYDDLAVSTEYVRRKQATLELEQQTMAGKLNDSISVSKNLIVEVCKLKNSLDRDKLFKLQSNVMIFGPKKAKEGKTLITAENVKKFIRQRITTNDGFRSLQFIDINEGMVKVRAVHNDDQVARQIAARILKLKEELNEKFDPYPKHDEPRDLRLRRKRLRLFLRSVKESLKLDEKTRCSIYKGLAFIGVFPLFPEYLWPDEERVPGKVVAEMASLVSGILDMKIEKDFSEEQLARGVFYVFAKDLLASYRGLPTPVEDKLLFVEDMSRIAGVHG